MILSQRVNLKRFLRSPKVIIGEIVGLTLFGAVGAAHEDWHVFSSAWFVALAAITAVSLVIVVLEQFRRLRAGWTLRLTESHFNSAPFRAEFERPATAIHPETRIWSEFHLGLAGSFVFHFGLLLIIVAGMLRALFATSATTDVLENETLAPKPSAWIGQFPGVLAKPFSLDREITLREVTATRYRSGDLRSLSVGLAVDGTQRDLRVNEEICLGGRRVYLGHEYGPAALLEWKGGTDAQAQKQCLLLREAGHGSFESRLPVHDNLRVYLRSHVDDAGNRSGMVEARVMDGNVLVSAAELAVGGTLPLPGGGSLVLHGLPLWARVHGSHDSALGLAFAGMILAMLGAAMIFILIKRDFCVIVTPLGERERVLVALKPQRFAPLFQERFERLVRTQRERGVGRAGAAGAPSEGSVAEPEEWERASLVPAVPDVVARSVCWLLFGTCLAMTAGCDRVSPAQARQLVERYNKYVSEAYRRGDIKLIDPVVGPNEGKKLTGLIGVRLDMGMTLDSRLLSLEVTGVERGKDQLRVRTRERWSYQNLKIGSGEPVGASSEDSYEMLYVFRQDKKNWLVDEIQFTAPPKVGTTNAPWVADGGALHGTTAAPPAGKGSNQP